MKRSSYLSSSYLLSSYLICVLASLLFISNAEALDCDCDPLQQAFQAQLLLVEKQRYTAMTSNNLDTLSTLLGDDLIYVHSTGVPQSKSEFLSDLREGKLHYRKITAQTTRLRFYGDISIINGEGVFDLTSGGHDIKASLIFTAVYTRRGEGVARRWELVSWHSCAAPQSKS
jgi:hypothetical protein